MNKAVIFNLQSDMPYRSLGAHRIATVMRDNNWDVEVIDWGNFFTLEELKQIAVTRITKETKLFGFSCNFGLFTSLIDDYITWIKLTYPYVTIVIGSQYIPDLISKKADYYVTGFGENAIIALLKYLESNGPSVKFKIINNKKVIDGNAFYPSFPLKSLNVRYEKRDFLNTNEWIGVEMSRGCKFECPYCNFPILGVKGDYTRDSEDYISQLQIAYDEFGMTKYLVADETFNDTTEKILKFANATEQLNFNPYLSAFVRADLLVARKQDKEHMARMGLLGHFYGIETMNTDTAKFIGKGMKTERLQEGLLDIVDYYLNQNLPFRGTLSLVVGLPKETLQTQEQTFNWIKDNWIAKNQSVKSFGLEIPAVDSNILKPSKISRDLTKYGYKINTDEYDNSYNAIAHGHVINWSNEHFTDSTAKEMANNFNDEVKHVNTLNNFTFAHFLDHPTELIQNNLTEVLAYEKDNEYYLQKINNIDAYKKLKLNQ